MLVTAIMWTGTRITIISLSAFLILSGCGVYTMNPKGKSEIRTIAIDPLENETTEFGLADQLTEFIIDAFIADGNLKVVSPDQADAILMGSLTHHERVTEAFDQNDQVQSYKMVMDFRITLQNASSGEDYWSQTTRQEGVYDADTETEEDGQRRAGARLVEMIINRTTKSW